MSEHLDLVGLLRGELGNSEAVRAGDHLETCTDCQEELVDAVVGHALLARAGRTLGAAEQLPPPPPLTAPARAQRRSRRGAVLVAAAAAVVVGVAGVGWWRGADQAPSAGGGIRATLSPVSAGAGDGSVRMVEHDGRTRMTLAVHDLPRTASGEFYYAWLLDPDTNKMLALGLVGPGRDVTFELDDALVSAYSAVDVSLEDDDGDPAHSVTSVLRGSYQPEEITTTERKPS